MDRGLPALQVVELDTKQKPEPASVLINVVVLVLALLSYQGHVEKQLVSYNAISNSIPIYRVIPDYFPTPYFPRDDSCDTLYKFDHSGCKAAK